MDEGSSSDELPELYSEIMPSTMTDNGRSGWSERQLMDLEYRREQFKTSLVWTFSGDLNIGL